uniref:Regulatory protein zeste n=1 Tax=Timema tahoe TaxID=61484 RepID=A0A7R9IJP0_9NEOP|nr:unnamed protein product [Timema tahoe]
MDPEDYWGNPGNSEGSSFQPNNGKYEGKETGRMGEPCNCRFLFLERRRVGLGLVRALCVKMEIGDCSAAPLYHGGNEYSRRASLWSADDEEIRVRIPVKYTEEYVSIIENKKTDAVTSQQKEAAWKSLADDFNKNITCVQRSSEQLKIYYENYKRRVKKATADDKVELYKTGGGTFTKQLDDEGAKLMALLKPQFVPLVNLSDSDAGYHIELPGEEKVEKCIEAGMVKPVGERDNIGDLRFCDWTRPTVYTVNGLTQMACIHLRTEFMQFQMVLSQGVSGRGSHT